MYTSKTQQDGRFSRRPSWAAADRHEDWWGIYMMGLSKHLITFVFWLFIYVGCIVISNWVVWGSIVIWNRFISVIIDLVTMAIQFSWTNPPPWAYFSCSKPWETSAGYRTPQLLLQAAVNSTKLNIDRDQSLDLYHLVPIRSHCKDQRFEPLLDSIWTTIYSFFSIEDSHSFFWVHPVRGDRPETRWPSHSTFEAPPGSRSAVGKGAVRPMVPWWTWRRCDLR